jgi:hypothetical protein
MVMTNKPLERGKWNLVPTHYTQNIVYNQELQT